MSNSDKFDQDDAIVNDNNVDEVANQGVLGGSDEPIEGEDSKISQDEFKNDEFDGVSKDNIVEGERSTRAQNFGKADEEADKLVEQAVDANNGQSQIA
ncbi:uncharacterized protein JCM15063_002650 [Sporobolomyces koalae]|uniref:uncharacterized protein n=1 Tax=Sporobolomyces koalae TaxID=500713 RepID=UPI00317C935B